jgi:hypothetical protein
VSEVPGLLGRRCWKSRGTYVSEAGCVINKRCAFYSESHNRHQEVLKQIVKYSILFEKIHSGHRRTVEAARSVTGQLSEGQVWWFIPVIPDIREMEVRGSWSEAGPGRSMGPCLKKN